MLAFLRRPWHPLWLFVLLPAVLVGVPFLVVCWVFYDTGNVLRSWLPVAPWDRVIVHDAIQRWATMDQSSPSRVMEDRMAVVVDADNPPRRCAELRFVHPSVGGTPVFCYRADADVLVSVDPGGE